MIERLPGPLAGALAPSGGAREGVRGGARVLLVEDDARDAELVADLLAEDANGDAPALTWVRRLSAARAALAEARPDVVLLDLSLPDATGLEAVEALCAEYPDVPIVVTTGLADDALAARAVHAGAQDYLVKGVEGVQGIRRAIRYAIERHAVARERAALLRRERAARAAAEEAERRAEFLAAASAALATSLDYRATLAAVTELAVPTVADCAVAFLARDGGSLEAVEFAHAATTEVEAVRARLTGLGDDGRLMALVHGARETGQVARGTVAPSDPADASGAHAYVAVPLRMHERTLGVLLLARCAPGRGFDDADVQLAEALADRAAVAVENARLYAEARRAVEMRDQVLGVLSHDLRNPLSAISMAARGLRGHADREVVELADVVGRSATWALHTIRDLLDVTAIEVGRLPIHRELMTVTAILESTAAMFTVLARERAISLTFDRAPTARWVDADVDRLVQALGNLVANAIKFTPSGGRVAVTVDADGPWLRFHVADTGPGIAAEELPHLFDRFWQGRGARRGGVGLGLAIVKGIAEGHGGRVEVASAVGAGSTFTLVLPAARPSAGREAGPDREAADHA